MFGVKVVTVSNVSCFDKHLIFFPPSKNMNHLFVAAFYCCSLVNTQETRLERGG